MHERRIFAGLVQLVILAGLLWSIHVTPILGMTTGKSTASIAEKGKGSAAESGASSAAGTILYIQTVRYKSGISDAQIKELLESLQRTLIHISEVKSIRVGRIIDESRQYDYAVVMEFDNLEDLHAYAISPIHRQWVESHNPGPLTENHMTLTIRSGLNR